jgi:hypothetical protein
MLHTHCCYCRRKFSDLIPCLKRTKDHFYPSSRLGFDTAENKLQCCLECNQWKADKLPEDWLREVSNYFSRKKKRGNYEVKDFAQIIGSLRHWIMEMKGKKISPYKS